MTEEEICKRLRAIDDFLASLGLSLWEEDEAEPFNDLSKPFKEEAKLP